MGYIQTHAVQQTIRATPFPSNRRRDRLLAISAGIEDATARSLLGRRGNVADRIHGVTVTLAGATSMARKIRFSAVGCSVALSIWPGLGTAQDIDAKSFRCIREMTPVRQFYIDNLRGNLDATLAAANSSTGAVYPPGSVVN
jgi:hypothetical protein